MPRATAMKQTLIIPFMKSKTKILAAILCAAVSAFPFAGSVAQITIVPQPRQVRLNPGKATIPANPKVYIDSKAKISADYVTAQLKETGLLPYAQNKDNVLAWAESRLKPVADKLIAEATQLTASHPADYDHPAFPELKIKGNKGNMTLMDGSKNPAGKSFYSITAGDRYFISQDKNGHYGLLDRYGREAIPCEYDSITVFRAMEKGGDLLLLQKDGKKGIAWTDGSLMLPCWYDDIEQIPGYHVFMAVDDNSYRAYKYTGVPRHVYSYDAYHYDPATGKVTVDYGKGLISRPMDKLGYDDMSRQIWLLGYNSKEPDKKLYYYLKAYEAVDDPNSDMTLLILRLIGSFYKEAGDNESARKYLGIAASHGDEGAKNMLGSIDFEEKYGKLEMPSLLDIASER